MDVIDCLAAVFSCIDHGAIPFRQALGARDFGRGPEQMPDQRSVFSPGIANRCDVLAGKHKNVYGRLRLDVDKRIALIVLEYRFGRDASINDLAEEATHSWF
jgi:hypothetical protein